MDRERAKELLPIIQAFADGKKIEMASFDDDGALSEWSDVYFPKWLDWLDNHIYRIKPEPKYRPFNTKEECWNEMLKHQPFGWVKSKDKGYFHLIGLVQFASELEDVMITFATSEQLARSSRSISENYIFADGTPFGIKEE